MVASLCGEGVGPHHHIWLACGQCVREGRAQRRSLVCNQMRLLLMTRNPLSNIQEQGMAGQRRVCSSERDMLRIKLLNPKGWHFRGAKLSFSSWSGGCMSLCKWYPSVVWKKKSTETYEVQSKMKSPKKSPPVHKTILSSSQRSFYSCSESQIYDTCHFHDAKSSFPVQGNVCHQKFKLPAFTSTVANQNWISFCRMLTDICITGSENNMETLPQQQKKTYTTVMLQSVLYHGGRLRFWVCLNFRRDIRIVVASKPSAFHSVWSKILTTVSKQLNWKENFKDEVSSMS